MTAVILSRPGTDIVDLSLNQRGKEEITLVLKDTLLDGSRDYHFAVTELSVPLTKTHMFGWLKSSQVLFEIHRRNVGVVFNEAYNYGETSVYHVLLQEEIAADVFDFPGWIDLLHGGDITFNLNGLTDAEKVVKIRGELDRQFTTLPLTDALSNDDPTTMSDISSYTLLTGRKFYDCQQFIKSLNEFATQFNQYLMKFGLSTTNAADGNVYHGGVLGDSQRFSSDDGVPNFQDAEVRSL